MDKNIGLLIELADGHDYLASYALGKLYYVGGYGIEVNYEKALHYLKEAADHGVVGANYYLGKMYYNGIGVQIDHAQAKDYFEKSAQGDNVFSNYYLGKIYYWGDGVKRDVAKAAQYKNSILNKPLYINQDTDINNFYSIADFESATQKYVTEIQQSVQNEYQKLYGKEC